MPNFNEIIDINKYNPYLRLKLLQEHGHQKQYRISGELLNQKYDINTDNDDVIYVDEDLLSIIFEFKDKANIKLKYNDNDAIKISGVINITNQKENSKINFLRKDILTESNQIRDYIIPEDKNKIKFNDQLDKPLYNIDYNVVNPFDDIKINQFSPGITEIIQESDLDKNSSRDKFNYRNASNGHTIYYSNMPSGIDSITFMEEKY